MARSGLLGRLASSRLQSRCGLRVSCCVRYALRLRTHRRRELGTIFMQQRIYPIRPLSVGAIYAEKSSLVHMHLILSRGQRQHVAERRDCQNIWRLS